MRHQTQDERNTYIDKSKIKAVQNLVVALKEERQTILDYGPFSKEAKEADKNTKIMRRRYNIWKKK